MQKVDLYQHLILSFIENIDSFGDNDLHVSGMMSNAGDITWYKASDIQIVVATIWPYEVDTHTQSVSYSDAEFLRYWQGYEKLRKVHKIPLLLNKNQLQDTTYTDYGLYIVYHLTGCDGINELGDIEDLYKGGVRIIQPVWEYDNAIAHSHRTTDNTGLTNFGKECILWMNTNHMLVDVAHMNHQSMIDVFQLSKKPLFNSHTNIKALFGHSRNVADDILELVGESGGLIGLSLESTTISGNLDAKIEDYLAQIKYVKDKIGDDHVAFGSGYHGLVYKKIITGYETIDKVQVLAQRIREEFGDKFASKFFWDNPYRLLIQGM